MIGPTAKCIAGADGFEVKQKSVKIAVLNAQLCAGTVLIYLKTATTSLMGILLVGVVQKTWSTNMLEKDISRAVTKGLGKYFVKCFKLHNDEKQVGLPDYLVWGNGLPVYGAEFKVADNAERAAAKVTPKQGSVLNSLRLTKHGAFLVYIAADARSGGFVWLKREGKHELIVQGTSLDSTAQALADRWYEFMTVDGKPREQ